MGVGMTLLVVSAVGRFDSTDEEDHVGSSFVRNMLIGLPCAIHSHSDLY